jgi:hypothetical protein
MPCRHVLHCYRSTTSQQFSLATYYVLVRTQVLIFGLGKYKVRHGWPGLNTLSSVKHWKADFVMLTIMDDWVISMWQQSVMLSL